MRVAWWCWDQGARVLKSCISAQRLVQVPGAYSYTLPNPIPRAGIFTICSVIRKLLCRGLPPVGPPKYTSEPMRHGAWRGGIIGGATARVSSHAMPWSIPTTLILPTSIIPQHAWCQMPSRSQLPTRTAATASGDTLPGAQSHGTRLTHQHEVWRECACACASVSEDVRA